MTIYGWDASHYDWDRGPMDMAKAAREGIVFATHKLGEGSSYTDPKFDDWWKRARAARIPLLGAYYVNHRGDQVAQADRMLRLLDQLAPGWRDGPFILQIDAERWGSVREPSPAEVRAFADRLVAKTGGKLRPVVYAPKWTYGDSLKGLPYPLWASSYGSNPAQSFRDAYPGDASSRWGAYSGQVPAILQYGSKTRIAGQGTCDANAFRGTLAQLVALVSPAHAQEEDDMDKADVKAAVLEAFQTAIPIAGNSAARLKKAGWATTLAPWTVLGYMFEHAIDGQTIDGIAAVRAELAAAEAREVARDAAQDALINAVVGAAGSPLTPEQLAEVLEVMREAAREAGAAATDRLTAALAAAARAEVEALTPPAAPTPAGE